MAPLYWTILACFFATLVVEAQGDAKYPYTNANDPPPKDWVDDSADGARLVTKITACLIEGSEINYIQLYRSENFVPGKPFGASQGSNPKQTCGTKQLENLKEDCFIGGQQYQFRPENGKYSASNGFSIKTMKVWENGMSGKKAFDLYHKPDNGGGSWSMLGPNYEKCMTGLKITFKQPDTGSRSQEWLVLLSKKAELRDYYIKKHAFDRNTLAA